ncbi:hypothetical protein BASA84_001129 [Batrachochytrium salamandrivorans]|nr:hypothetical protein BASA84_001129 [Batrachochytrium salamandrivorans]
MHFFYLLSFVVVASYAAALPQPAGLSGKYSNNADANLASILEARSYQPGFNPQKNSATLMSLERRAGSAGSSRVNSGFNVPPLSTLSSEEAKVLINSLFKKDAFSFSNISSTIKNVGDGIAELSENGEKVKTKIVGTAGGLLAKYLSRNTYVSVALIVSATRGLNTIASFIESTTTPDDFYKVFSDFLDTFTELITAADKKEKESNDLIVDILKGTGTVLRNVEAAIKLLVDAVASSVKIFDAMKTLIGRLESGRTIYDEISNMMRVLSSLVRNNKSFRVKL